MSHKIEIHNCSNCGVETRHVLVLVRKESEYKNSKNRKFKEFISGVIKGWALGAFVASMDEFDRHLVCENCGNKIID